MTDRRQYPDYEIEEFFEATEPEHHEAFADLQDARGGRVRACDAPPADQCHYGEALQEHLPPNNLLGAQHLPASMAGYFAGKVLELVRGLEVDPAPCERVYVFLGTVFLTNQPELLGEES